jgi:hypothetical protein
MKTEIIAELRRTTTLRATGKSHLLAEGVKNYERPFMLVCKSIQEGKRLTSNNPNASYITPTDLKKLYGTNKPIIFDQEVVKEYLLKILDLEGDIDVLEDKLERCKTN